MNTGCLTSCYVKRMGCVGDGFTSLPDTEVEVWGQWDQSLTVLVKTCLSLKIVKCVRFDDPYL